jgi:hypothetical protein
MSQNPSGPSTSHSGKDFGSLPNDDIQYETMPAEEQLEPTSMMRTNLWPCAHKHDSMHIPVKPANTYDKLTQHYRDRERSIRLLRAFMKFLVSSQVKSINYMSDNKDRDEKRIPYCFTCLIDAATPRFMYLEVHKNEAGSGDEWMFRLTSDDMVEQDDL